MDIIKIGSVTKLIFYLKYNAGKHTGGKRMIHCMGSMILKLRQELKISQEQLGRGLTDIVELSRLENGGKETDRFLLEALFQRLGKSVDKFEVTVSDEEYRLILLRSLILENFTVGYYDVVAILLQEYKEQPKSGKPLHRQFVQELESLLDYQVRGEASTCLQGLSRALEITFPGWRQEAIADSCLCIQEIQILLLLLMVLTETGKVKVVRAKLEELIAYLEKRYTDPEELAEVYPQCTWLLARACCMESDYGRAYDICCRGIQRIAESGNLIVAGRLLELQRYCLEKMERRKEAVRTEQVRQAMLFLYELTECSEPDDISCILITGQREELLINRELLKDMREAQGLSQEELSADICSWETLSRIENGKRNPNRKNLYKMFKKLKLDRENYYGYIQADSFELYEMTYLLQRAVMRDCEEEEVTLVEKLEQKLDMTVPVNRQFIESCKLEKAIRNKEIDEKTAIKEAERILRYTMKDYCGNVYRTPFREECVLLNQIALCLKHIGRKEDAIQLWEQILDKFNNSAVANRHHMVSEFLIYMNYPPTLEVCGYLEKSEREALFGLGLALRCQKGDVSGVILANLACVYERYGTQKAKELFEKCLRCSYELLRFYGCERDSLIVSDYYRTKFNQPIK